MVDCMKDTASQEVRVWLASIRSAPYLINRVALVSPSDRERLIELAAERMRTTGTADIRPALLVQILLAAS